MLLEVHALHTTAWIGATPHHAEVDQIHVKILSTVKPPPEMMGATPMASMQYRWGEKTADKEPFWCRNTHSTVWAWWPFSYADRFGLEPGGPASPFKRTRVWK